MTLKRGPITLLRGKDRLFERADQFVMLTTGLNVGVMWAAHGYVILNKGDTAVIPSEAFPVALEIPLHGVLDAAFRNEKKQSITVSILPHDKSVPAPEHPAISETKGFNEVLFYPIMPIFVEFIEGHKRWFENKSLLQKSWPPIFLFACAVRNAMSHGGKIYMKYKNAREVQWHHLKFGKEDHGKQMIGENGFLSIGDVFILMLEVSDELDTLGCPLDPIS